ncbi:three-Cys-motif partner protein TcmP [Sphingomonas sp. TX0522]|uniref:three-Cys-motif partner protein TcmP n=1 Tax=Sphingomonas sp. TX0522 TaxID=2479205 RepID=UPI0018E04E52|nr:three-Cys-motif partner protein TcmP [Sphingomonas sp. TX0522]MBI0533059.1 three-Cys-motif partner protein TcmP [Sphingomonas sp. TX0522]
MAKKKPYDWKIGGKPPQLGDHSAAKHEVFERYVEIYIDKLTSMPSREHLHLTIVDGFCGGGTYSHRGAIVDGSPFRLLSAVTQAEASLAAARTKGFRISCDFFFVDVNRHHIEHLRSLLELRGYRDRIGRDIHLRTMSFDEAYPEIRDRIRAGRKTSHRSLFFLDQYGWSDVSLGTIRTILTDLANPEILLTFAVDFLIDYLSDHPSMMKALMDLDFAREDVRDLIDLRTDQGDAPGWRYLIQNRIYRHVVRLTQAKFYTPFFIHSRESHRSYWLLHLARHRQARDEMGKLHWAIKNSFQHHGGPGFHSLGFDPDKDLRDMPTLFEFDDVARTHSEEVVIGQLAAMIHDANRTSLSPPTVEELFTAHCNDTPVTTDILQKVLIKLRDEREIELIGDGGKLKPRAVTVDWDDRLALPAERSLFASI